MATPSLSAVVMNNTEAPTTTFNDVVLTCYSVTLTTGCMLDLGVTSGDDHTNLGFGGRTVIPLVHNAHEYSSS
jgi:hypothetical protein